MTHIWFWMTELIDSECDHLFSSYLPKMDQIIISFCFGLLSSCLAVTAIHKTHAEDIISSPDYTRVPSSMEFFYPTLKEQHIDYSDI